MGNLFPAERWDINDDIINDDDVTDMSYAISKIVSNEDMNVLTRENYTAKIREKYCKILDDQKEEKNHYRWIQRFDRVSKILMGTIKYTDEELKQKSKTPANYNFLYFDLPPALPQIKPHSPEKVQNVNPRELKTPEVAREAQLKSSGENVERKDVYHTLSDEIKPSNIPFSLEDDVLSDEVKEVFNHSPEAVLQNPVPIAPIDHLYTENTLEVPASRTQFSFPSDSTKSILVGRYVSGDVGCHIRMKNVLTVSRLHVMIIPIPLKHCFKLIDVGSYPGIMMLCHYSSDGKERELVHSTPQNRRVITVDMDDYVKLRLGSSILIINPSLNSDHKN
jgi:hypothetical protein